MKTILIDARMYGLEYSGIGRYLINLVKGIAGSRADLKFVILLRKKYYSLLELPGNWIKILADFNHYSLAEQIRLPAIIGSVKPDLVHFPHLNFPIFYSGKFVVTIHDLTMQRQKHAATTLPLPLYYLKRIPFLIVAGMAVKKSEWIIAPTQSVAEDIAHYYKKDIGRIIVINEGVAKSEDINIDFKSIKVKYGISHPYFLYVGNAYPHKNLARAIEAMVMVNKHRGTKVDFVIGGSRNVFTKRLSMQISKFGASNFVKQIGYVSDDDLFLLHQNSIGFLYPSLAEGFGLQGLEAISSGTILLCSNIPVFKEVYKDSAFYFDPNSAESIAATMKHVIRLGQVTRNKLVKSAQKYIQKYTWDKMTEKTLEVYDSAV